MWKIHIHLPTKILKLPARVGWGGWGLVSRFKSRREPKRAKFVIMPLGPQTYRRSKFFYLFYLFSLIIFLVSIVFVYFSHRFKRSLSNLGIIICFVTSNMRSEFFIFIWIFAYIIGVLDLVTSYLNKNKWIRYCVFINNILFAIISNNSN